MQKAETKTRNKDKNKDSVLLNLAPKSGSTKSASSKAYPEGINLL